MKTTYVFKEEVDLKALAARIVNTSDPYDIADCYDSEDDAINEVIDTLQVSPLSIIEYLLELVEDLQA